MYTVIYIYTHIMCVCVFIIYCVCLITGARSFFVLLGISAHVNWECIIIHVHVCKISNDEILYFHIRRQKATHERDMMIEREREEKKESRRETVVCD